MAEPFVFYFQPDASGRPEILYILDLDCRCHLCGHEQFQRFYHSTPFHELTLDDLDVLAEDGHLKADYECENCGESVGPQEVRRSALTFGFADETGLIHIYVDHLEDQKSYELVPRRRLDPQAVPRWWPDPANAPRNTLITSELDDEILEDHLGRPFNVKLAWTDLLEDFLDDPEGGAFSNFGPHLWAAIDHSEEAAGELAQEIDDDDFWDAFDAARLAIISLHDSIPDGLATHKHPQSLDGRWQTWLPDTVLNAIDQHDLWADAYLSRNAAIKAVTRAFKVARLNFTLQHTEADTFFIEITTPTGTVFGQGLTLSSILRRAVYTGITPGEAGRLTAEEILWLLLDIKPS